LVRVYLDGYEKHHEFASDPQEFVASGLRAVVRALRDHLRREATHWSHGWGIIEVENEINEILGDAGNEKVAGSTPASTGRLDSVKGEPPASPATDAAPAVCKWTLIANGRYRVECMNYFGLVAEKWLKKKVCPRCSKPIKFTEANHG
tara:strand:- start:53 stop:496 length:444 start_codon:yes stop_codon:yes gene_type:complete